MKTSPKTLLYINAWQKAHPTRVLEYKRRYRQRNYKLLKIEGRERARVYRKAHLEHVRRLQRCNYWRNVEKCRAQMRAYQKRTKQSSRWRKMHPEQAAVYNRLRAKRWRRSNPDKARLYARISKARRRGTGRLSRQQWLHTLEKFEHRCAYCGAPEKLTIDHKTPIALGGTNAPKNIQPLCSSCNSRKWKFTWLEFIQRQKLIAREHQKNSAQ